MNKKALGWFCLTWFAIMTLFFLNEIWSVISGDNIESFALNRGHLKEYSFYVFFLLGLFAFKFWLDNKREASRKTGSALFIFKVVIASYAICFTVCMLVFALIFILFNYNPFVILQHSLLMIIGIGTLALAPIVYKKLNP